MAGIYFHIPFCKQACNYCNFHFSTSLQYKEEMLSAMEQELVLQKNYLEGQVLETIYFGGGTPSLLPVEALKALLGAVEKYFPLQYLQEVTIEVNPDDVNMRFLKSLKATPVNRFSMGIQSFRDEDLRFMNRAHNAMEADYAVKAAQDAGFENISVDLIYGTPGMNDGAWRQNIDTAVQLQVPHISAYALTVEPRTALAHQIAKGKVVQPDHAQSAAQFDILMERLAAAGYDHYEISNFARPGQYAMHNTNYWKGQHYLGLGPSAHSFNGESRQWNIANNSFYMKSILESHILPFEKEMLSQANKLNEYIMTSLRTMWGLDLQKVEGAFGMHQASRLKDLSKIFIEEKKMQLAEEHLILTPSGRHFADGIAADLFFDE